MIKLSNDKKSFFIYLIKFALIFCFCYFGTLAIIGLSAPGGYYSAFVQTYLDYVSILRKTLLHGSKLLLSGFGYLTKITNFYTLQLEAGRGVHIGYDCLGYGVMSFWIAFVIANTGKWLRKLQWIAVGILLIWLINITRISMLLLAINHHSAIPLFDHHTWFNILAYLLIFVLIYFYDRSAKMKQAKHEVG